MKTYHSISAFNIFSLDFQIFFLGQIPQTLLGSKKQNYFRRKFW